jgi:hypothetical protein
MILPVSIGVAGWSYPDWQGIAVLSSTGYCRRRFSTCRIRIPEKCLILRSLLELADGQGIIEPAS